MKKIENRKVIITNPADKTTGEYSYSEIIDSCIKYVPVNAAGLTYEVMKSIGRVEPLLEKGKPELQLEDADFSFVKSKVMAMQWAFYHKEFLEFQLYIERIDLAGS